MVFGPCAAFGNFRQLFALFPLSFFRLAILLFTLVLCFQPAKAWDGALQARTGDGEVRLIWPAAAGASSYTIWAVTDGQYSAVASGITATSYSLRGLVNDASYSYYVTAETSLGTSAPSNIVTITPTAGAGSILRGLLAHDPFDAPPGALLGVDSGSGWAAPWDVSGNSADVPGFSIGSGAAPLVNGLAQTGNYAVGGFRYYAAGRRFDIRRNGPFSDYLSNGLIGTPGTTLWMSIVMRKDVQNQDEFYAALHAGNVDWWVQTPGVEAGYFGWDSYSNADQVGYWSLRIDGVVYRTSVPVVLGQPALLVVRIDFGSTSTASLYVNPPLGSSSAPGTPDVQAATTNLLAFQNLAFVSGWGTNETAIDEVRVAATYKSVTTATATVAPAPIGLTATAGSNQVLLSWKPVGEVTGYGIWGSTDGTNYSLLATVTGTTFTHTGLTNGSDYSYYVTALGGAGMSLPSESIAAVPKPPPPPTHTVLGTNLSGIADYTREWPFVDAFRLARPWIPQQEGEHWGQGPPLDLTPDGWVASLQPGQFAETIIFDNGLEGAANYPTGQYTLLYDGEGTIEPDLHTFNLLSQTPGRMVLDVLPGQLGIFLKLTQTNPANPLRNIRLIMPGFEATYQTEPFHPTFLARLQHYQVLRFMEWMLTNNSPVQTWDDRPTLNDYTQSLRGVALETMIQLANTLHVSPWFNIPQRADDDYVRQFATMVQQQLDPGLKVYIEYSNETWNEMFTQAADVRRWGQDLGLNQDATLAGAYYSAKRSVEIFRIFEQVFGGTDRLVRVLGSQASSTWLSEQIVSYRNSFGHADALAIAPYFSVCSDQNTGGWGFLGNPETADQVATMSVDQVLDIELSHIRNCVREEIRANVQLANKYGLKLVAYEGGQHLVGVGGVENNPELTEIFKAANRNPRMKDLYAEYLENWKELGGDLFVHFTDVTSYTKYGSFGSLENQNQDPATAPKYQALMDFASENP